MTIPGVAIKIDSEETWPLEVRRLLDDHFEVPTPGGKFDEPAHHEVVSELAERIRGLLKDERLVCCHCSRLTDDEVEDVRQNGLQLRTADLIESRIARRHANGDLADWEAKWLREHSLRPQRILQDGGRIWAVLGHAALVDELGLGNLLACWGGEVMLEMSMVPSRFYKLGQGCIIEFTVGPEEFNEQDIGAAFLHQYLCNRDLHDSDGAVTISITCPVLPQDIRRVVLADAPLFEKWTGASGWRMSPYSDS